MFDVTIFITFCSHIRITWNVSMWMVPILFWFEHITIFVYPNSCNIWFWNWFINVCNITVFIAVSSHKFVTIKVFFWMFTVLTRFQYVTLVINPNGCNLRCRSFLKDMFEVTIFITLGANIGISRYITMWMFTICTRFQNITLIINPNSCDIWFRNWFIDMSDITIFIFIRSHKLITIKVFFRMFPILSRFKNFTCRCHPNSSNFWNRFINMGNITIFIAFGTNIFITIKGFFRMLTILTRFQNFTGSCHPNSGYIVFRHWFVDVMSITIIIFYRFNEFITIKLRLRLFPIFPWS